MEHLWMGLEDEDGRRSALGGHRDEGAGFRDGYARPKPPKVQETEVPATSPGNFAGSLRGGASRK